MARRPSTPSQWLTPLSSLFIPRGETLFYLIALFSIFSLTLHHLSFSSVSAASTPDPHFEGFDAEDDESFENDVAELPLGTSPPPTTLSHSDPIESHHGPPSPDSNPPSSDSDSEIPSEPFDLHPQPSSPTSFYYWDEDEFEGLPEPQKQSPPEDFEITGSDTPSVSDLDSDQAPVESKSPKSYSIEIACISFLIMFIVNFFSGKKENENIALAWASKFATKGSIFEKNFSLLGVGETEDAPLLLKEGQSVFKFYASGRRFCAGLLATMELKSRHDLISRLYNMVVPCKDEITFVVYMNDDAMDQVMFAVAKKKLAKAMHKEGKDLQKFACIMPPPSNRKWVAEELTVISESKEVAGDMITEAVLDQVFGDKAFEKFGKGFISMHFSDQHFGTRRKMLVFKFSIPDVNKMADMTRLVALVPYYIDLIGRYKLSSQARSKMEAARLKAAQEAYKELQNARQEALQKKKAERKKMLEEAEAKLSAEALRKKEAKERARQLKRAMPKVKMSRAG